MNGLNNPFQMINALKSNPAAFLGQRGIQIPKEMNDPNAILNQMLGSGRYSQAQINRAYQMARQMFPTGAQEGNFVNKPKGT